MIAAMYARKSTDHNVPDEGKSVTRHVRSAYAPRKGWTEGAAKAMLLAIAASGVLVGTAVAGDLSGDVFVLTQSGDVKRGAGVGVSIIPATPEFEAARARAKQDVAARALRLQSADRTLASARKERDAAYAAFRDSAVRRTNQNLPEDDPEYVAASKRNTRSMAALEQAEREVTALRSAPGPDWSRELQRLVVSHRTKEVVADVNGHYAEKSVPNGRYYLYATHRIFDTTLCWFVPVEVTGGATRLDLSGRNAGCLPSS